MSLIAQTTPGELLIPDVAWSAFAPELAPTITAFVLLLLAVAKGPRQYIVAAPVALLSVAGGAWLIVEDHLVPGIVTVLLGLALPALVAAFPRRLSLVQTWGAALSLLAALVLTGWQYIAVMDAADAPTLMPQEALGGAIANDGIAFFARVVVYLTALIVVPMGYGYLKDRKINRAEVEPLLLLSVVGMVSLALANDLITLFVALEVFSLGLYVLSGLARRDRRSQESSLKYFIMGAVASAILLYGMALLYVATGTVEMSAIASRLGLLSTEQLVAVLGVALVTIGIGFKVALAPFHLWAADVYQGAPTNITAFMAAATKAAGFAALLRLYLVAFPPLQSLWVPVLSVLAALTMLYGAYLAVVQRDLKRMLAYSSITHAGYATVGVVAVSNDGLSATLWYLLTYAVSTLAAFGCVIAIERVRQGEVTLNDLRGLGRTSPALAGVLALSLLSLAGLPPTAGFVGKLMVFQAGVASGLTWLVVIGVLSSVVAAFFYLRIAGMMFLESPKESAREPIVSGGLFAGILASAALVVFLGIQPELFLHLADTAAALVR